MMKVSDSQPAGGGAPANARGEATRPHQDEQSRFSKLLAKKRSSEQDDSAEMKDDADPADPSRAPMLQVQPSFDSTIQPAQIEEKHLVAIPAELQHLVKEIAVVANRLGNKEVHIEMNSTVMKGLHIRIEKQEGGVAIQFDSSHCTPEVTRMLESNLQNLSQSLEEHGITVEKAQVVGPDEATRKGGYRSASSRSQGSRQGGRGR